jgi:hypothetical protein
MLTPKLSIYEYLRPSIMLLIPMETTRTFAPITPFQVPFFLAAFSFCLARVLDFGLYLVSILIYPFSGFVFMIPDTIYILYL